MCRVLYKPLVNMRLLYRVMNMPKLSLIMSQYAWICVNNAEYDWICHHIPEKPERWICRNSDCVWCSQIYRCSRNVSEHKATVQITEQLSRQRRIQNNVKHLIWRVLQKEKSLIAGAQPETLQGKGGEEVCWNYTLRKNLPKTQEKKAPQEKNWIFFPIYSWDYILNGRFKQKMTTIRAFFFPKSGYFFSTFKEGRRDLSPPPNFAPVNMTEYASTSLNMIRYPLTCLNKLFWLC